MSDSIEAFVRSLNNFRVWSALGLPGEPSQSCKCPKHQDGSASFSMYRSRRDGRWLWMCHAGCGHGDLIDLWVMMTGKTKGEALRDMRRAFGSNSGGFAPTAREWIPAAPGARPKPILAMDAGSDAEFTALAELRKLPESALRLAAERGLLRFADHKGARCWVITDPEGWAISCRPLGANPWGETKSLMVKNTHAAHLIGSPHLQGKSLVFMCEGGPDLLAAHAVMHYPDVFRRIDTTPVIGVAMLSASSSPAAAACEAFHGTTVVIWAHSDPAGIEAAERWARQLRPHAQEVHVIQAGEILAGVKDLNDVVSHEDGQSLITKALKKVINL